MNIQVKSWAPQWMARLVWVVGVVLALRAINPRWGARWVDAVELFPVFSPEVTRAANLALGAILVLLAGGLRRRKRRAWSVATLAAATVVALHMTNRVDLEQLLVAGALLVLLLATRGAFNGRPDPRSLPRVALSALASAAVTLLLGGLLMLVDLDGTTSRPTAGQVAQQVLLGMVGVSGPVQFTSARRSDLTSIALLLLGVVFLGSVLFSLLRSARGPGPLHGADEGALRALLGAWGGDSLGYFALRDDRAVIFSASGKAAVSYRVVRGVSLAAGDPLGDPEAWPGAIDAWRSEAASFAWTPAVLAASQRGAQAYQRAGFDALELGDEAVVDTAEFTLDGRSMRGVRQAVNRMERAGYRVQVDRAAHLPEQEVEQARAACDRWRDGEQERGFAMALGRFGDPRDDGCWLVRAHRSDGQLCAVLQLVPWGRDGLSLDLMRRAPDADNGVVEAAIVGLLRGCADRGVTRVSLNFAVFRSTLERGAQIGAGPVLRLWRRVLLGASRFWQIESLYRANAKYQPEWVPRYLCFESARDLARVTVAALEAEAFITAPTSLVPGGRWRRSDHLPDARGRFRAST